MKTCLLILMLFLSAMVSADPIEGKLTHPGEKKKVAHSPNKREMLVITEAKIVPLIEFLGFPNINKLPPTSAGETKPIDVQID